MRRGFAATTAQAVVIAVTVIFLVSCGAIGPGYQESLLNGLEAECGRVASSLEAEDISAYCEDNSWLLFEVDDAEYTATDVGVQWIETEKASLSLFSLASDGHVQGIAVSVGGGIDAAKARYSMRDLSKPKVFYWGDDIEWVQSSIEKEISTDEMKELVAQAEHYQDVIRAELDKLESKK